MKPMMTRAMKSWLVGSAIAIAVALPVAPVSADTQNTEGQKQMQQMQDRMKKLHQEMDRIHQTQDPQERQKLMREHMQTMQEQMKDLRGMGGGMMTGMMGDHGKGMHDKAMMNEESRAKTMQDRMDMMQMMMEQMMDHMQLRESSPAK